MANLAVSRRLYGLLLLASISLLPGCGVLYSRPHSATLIWKPSTTPEVKYNVYRTVMPDGRRIKLTPQPIAETKFVDSDLAAGQTYTYEVSSVDSKGVEGPPSSQVVATVPKP